MKNNGLKAKRMKEKYPERTLRGERIISKHLAVRREPGRRPPRAPCVSAGKRQLSQLSRLIPADRNSESDESNDARDPQPKLVKSTAVVNDQSKQ
jgi:hypothetical protein